MSTLIIFGIFIVVAFYSGYYFGYQKREGKPPELPVVTSVADVLDKAKKKPEKPSREELKANDFFN